jgi:tetraprenyl-beta-curcumene synthase
MWCEKHNALCPELKWNEFAAATGSTLGVFMLFLAASHRNYSIEQIENIRDAYFPYIAGLHILLDYLIDQEEDLAGGDLNFCSYYNNRDETIRRITFMVKSARAKILCLEHTRFHRMIIEGLLALYLSDPKIKSQTEVRKISKQLMKNSPITRIFFWVNSVYIRFTS